MAPTAPSAAALSAGSALAPVTLQPAWVRLAHWLNVLAVLILVTSGWRIYNASPIFDFKFPKDLTLGGWLGGALLWHFAAMWLLAVNGLVYLAGNIASGRLGRRFWPLSPRAVVADLIAALRGKLAHDDLAHYNAVQKLAYLGAIALLILVVLSGLAVWKPVQLSPLRELMGGFDNARIVHFVAMSGIVAFVVIHVIMVALVPRSFLLMVRGR